MVLNALARSRNKKAPLRLSSTVFWTLQTMGSTPPAVPTPSWHEARSPLLRKFRASTLAAIR